MDDIALRREDLDRGANPVRRNRSVKIVATLGPASSEPEQIERLFIAGADVFRINMSHTPQRALEALAWDYPPDRGAMLGRPIGILADLQGPKLRIGTFAGKEAQLVEGAQFIFDTDPAPGDAARVFLPAS